MADQQKPPAGGKPAAGVAKTPGAQTTTPNQPLKAGSGGLKPAPSTSTRITLSKGRTKVGVNYKAQAKAEEQKKKEEEDRVASVPLEDRVYQLTGLKEQIPPGLFKDFLDKIFHALALSDTSLSILGAFSNIDVTAERVCQVIRANPYYENVFLRVIETLGKRQEMPSLEGAVVLLGMQNFRNLIISTQAVRTVVGNHVEWDKEGKLKLLPNDILKYAIRAEDHLLTTKSAYSDTAYAAGLVFDLLVLVSAVHAQDKKKHAAFIDNVFNHGMRTAQIGLELVKLIPDFGFKKYIFAACLLHDVGKVCTALINPDYLNFLEEGRKKEWPRAVHDYVENTKFNVHHSVFGGLVCFSNRMFRPIEKVIECHHSPYLLYHKNKNLFQLASLVCLSTNIANHFKKTDRVDDPIVQQWKGVELRDFKIDMRSVVKSVAESIQI